MKKGDGQYGFIHLTFEEYFAAVGIAIKGQGNPEIISKILMSHIENPVWRETILLTIGYISLIQNLKIIAGEVIEILLKNEERSKGLSVLVAAVKY